MNIEIQQVVKSEQRESLWTCKVTEGQIILFDNSWVSVKFHSEESSLWFANIIKELYTLGVKVPRNTIQTWEGDLEDDCSLQIDELHAHAEHMEGPRGKGGIWYCSVSSKNSTYFHTADFSIQARSGKAARWLSEVIILGARNDVLQKYA